MLRASWGCYTSDGKHVLILFTGKIRCCWLACDKFKCFAFQFMECELPPFPFNICILDLERRMLGEFMEKLAFFEIMIFLFHLG